MLKIDAEMQFLIPPLSTDERATLEANIVEAGCRDALVIWQEEGILLDGHNRFDICNRNGIPFDTREISLPDREAAMDWMIKNQLGRRNLSPEQFKYYLGKRYSVEKKNVGEHKGNQYLEMDQIDPFPTASRLAKEYGTSAATVKRAEKFAEQVDAEPELKAALMQGGTVRPAIRELKKERHKEKIANPPPLKKIGPYQLVLSDPPWRYDHQQAGNRNIENHYPTADLETIKSHVPETEDNAILFLWATAPKLTEAIEVMAAWGFRYVTNAVWDKQKIGMGYWFRGQHELLLVGVKGKPGTVPECERRSSVFSEARGQHSAKPVCVYEWIERSFPDRTKLEMYCRTPRKSWVAWGNQV